MLLWVNLSFSSVVATTDFKRVNICWHMRLDWASDLHLCQGPFLNKADLVLQLY